MGNIEFKNLHKNYGKTEVIHGIDGTMNDGEFVVIVGPSGCGKSTLLRMIAGLESITDGDIEINGKRVNDLEPAERDIAMVFQTYALYPHMSVYENMSYGLKIQKIPKDEIKRRVHAAADILEITSLLDRQPRHISGGQRQRVAMGRAIVREPAVFLFDEPLSNLDAKLRVQMRLEIKKLQGRLGITSVYVTHDQVEAMTLGDRLMVMNEGVVEQFGTPIDLYQRPASVFVAGFIGSPSMNFAAAKLDTTGGKLSLENGVTIGLTKPIKAAANSAVTLGIRPEHLHVEGSKTASKASKSSASITLDVDVIEQLGADTLVHGHLAGSKAGSKATKSQLSVRLPGIQTFERSSQIKLIADQDALHLFDAKTGARIN